MSSAKPDPLTIPPKLEVEMTPAVRAFVESLLERIRKLEAKGGVSPQNSSLPPSTQHPHARPPRGKRKSKRKRGGQPGHPKHQRPLIPVENCDDNQAKRLGYDLRRATRKLFEHWANYRDGPISRAAFVRRMAPVRREVERLLLRGVQSGNASLVGMCRELHEHRAWLWTFVRQEGRKERRRKTNRILYGISEK